MSPKFGIKRGIKRPERAEMAKASVRHPENLDAYSLYWRGVEMHRHFTRSDNPKGREVFAKVIALDPNYARAYAAWAWTHYYDWQNRWIRGNPKESYQKGLDLAYKAVAPDPRDGWVRGTLANFLLYGNKHHEAVAQFEEALRANPNDADLLVFSSAVDLFGGRPKEALQRIKEAMRLNPYHPNWYFVYLGHAQYQSHDYKGASRRSGRCRR
jgi:adenylate cyclase